MVYLIPHRPYLKAVVWTGVFMLLCGDVRGTMAADLPQLSVQYLGTGSPVAINNNRTVAGARTVVGTSNYEPIVSLAGQPWMILPVPVGTMSAFPTDLNNNDVITGVAFDSQFNALALRWLKNGNSYSVEVLPRLTGDSSSYATGINNLGDIVGARRALGYVPASSSGWLYDGTPNVVDLQMEYNLDIYPTDLNDVGEVISGTALLDLITGDIELVGSTGPGNYQPIIAVDLNNSGQILGSAALRSTSLNIVSIFRYTPGSGWTQIAGTSRYTVATDLNELGDIGYGELGTGIYLEGLGTFPLFELLNPADRAAGWTITGSGCVLNDQRVVVANGQNSITGVTGSVLLTPNGFLPTPAAPSNFQGAAHPATPSEPYNSIDLSWTNTSNLTRTYELERSVTTENNWQNIPLVAPGTGTFHQDTTVSPGVTYDYRIRAVGVAGPGAWSAVITVTAPTPPPEDPVMKVTDIILSGRSLGRLVIISGRVVVEDENGRGLSGAQVEVRWTLPNGSMTTTTSTTNASGQARISQRGPHGPYQVTILGVTKNGYQFDAAGSVVTDGISQ